MSRTRGLRHHQQSTADDASRYRNDEEVGRHWKEEPIARLRAYPIEAHSWAKKEEEGLIETCAAEVAAATEEYPAEIPEQPGAIFDHLYDTPPREFGGIPLDEIGGELDCEAVVGVECDIWIPAARPDAISREYLNGVKARLILQGANTGVTEEAEAILHERGEVWGLMGRTARYPEMTSTRAPGSRRGDEGRLRWIKDRRRPVCLF
jgi:hypothetical protein